MIRCGHAAISANSDIVACATWEDQIRRGRFMKVLYVEDDADLRDLGALALELDPEIEIRTVESAELALAILDDGSWAPDVLLLDVMMPDIDGPSLLQAIRTRPQFDGIPAIFLTARSMPGEVARYGALGARGVITKPFDPLTLAARIRSLAGL